MSFLARKGLTVNTIVTDRHPQIQKLFHDKMPETTYYYDGWHIGKSLGCNLESVAKEKDCEEVRPCIKSITNHLDWCAGSSGGDAYLVISKWMSVVEQKFKIFIQTVTMDLLLLTSTTKSGSSQVQQLQFGLEK